MREFGSVNKHLAAGEIGNPQPPSRQALVLEPKKPAWRVQGRSCALVAGDSRLEAGANLILFGPPGGGKTHLAAAVGLGLIENGPISKIGRVLFTRTTDLVQKLQVARRELALEAAIARLDKYQFVRRASRPLEGSLARLTPR